jgi:DNA/RNA endonuclease YhcR with UshA esterase domain
MNEINLHDVQKILVTERRDFDSFSAMTIRIVTGLGNLDVVLFSHEAETLEIKNISNEDL